MENSNSNAHSPWGDSDNRIRRILSEKPNWVIKWGNVILLTFLICCWILSQFVFLSESITVNCHVTYYGKVETNGSIIQEEIISLRATIAKSENSNIHIGTRIKAKLELKGNDVKTFIDGYISDILPSKQSQDSIRVEIFSFGERVRHNTVIKRLVFESEAIVEIVTGSKRLSDKLFEGLKFE